MPPDFIPIDDAAKPVLTRLALQELDICIERLRSVRELLASSFAHPEQDIPTRNTQEPNK
jgi:hypothetical protein